MLLFYYLCVRVLGRILFLILMTGLVNFFGDDFIIICKLKLR